MTTKNRKPRAASSRQRRRRREEQLGLDLAPPEHGSSKLMPNLDGEPRAPAASDTRSTRLRHGVLVQLFLR